VYTQLHILCVAELYCYHTRPRVADNGTSSRYRGLLRAGKSDE